MRTPDASAQKGTLLGAYAVGGSLITILQRYLTFYYDSYAQNFYRFLAGSAGLTLLSFVLWRRQLAEAWRDRPFMWRSILLAALSVVAGMLFIEGLARTSAAVGGLLSLLGLPLTLILAVLVFPDERQAARDWRTIVGVALALGSTLGLTLGDSQISWEYSLGSLYLALSALVNALASLFTKRLVSHHQPICVGAINSSLMCLMYLAIGLCWGDLGRLWSASTVSVLILFGSGVYGLLMGLGLYMVNIRRYGLVTTRIAELSMPVFTAIFGYFLFGESLTSWQLVYGAILIVGSGLVVSARPRRS